MDSEESEQQRKIRSLLQEKNELQQRLESVTAEKDQLKTDLQANIEMVRVSTAHTRRYMFVFVLDFYQLYEV